MKCTPWICSVLVLLSCAWISGCGPKLAKVEGMVTFDGKPVERGAISFEPSDGKGPSAGSTLENGKYAIGEVLPGPKKVRITGVKVLGTKRAYEDDPNSPMTETTAELLPSRYNAQSELTLDVQAPETKADFSLESKASGQPKT